MAASVATVLVSACPGDRPPKPSGVVTRLVTMTPSATEIASVLGAADLLVGVDEFSKVADKKNLPTVGDFLAPDVVSILRLQPDLVVLDSVQGEAAKSLRRAGVPTLLLPMHTLEDLRHGVERMGEALDKKEQARVLVARLDRVVTQVKTRSRRGDLIGVVAIIDRQPGKLSGMVAAGPGSYLDALLNIAGARNALERAPVRYPKVSADRLLRLAPAVILDASAGGKANIADWQTWLRAAPKIRVETLPGHAFLSPTPAIVEALPTLEALLREPSQPLPASSSLDGHE